MLGSLLAGTAACVGLDVVGGFTTCVGFALTQATPGGSTGNCAEDCARGFAAGIAVAIGLALGVTGIILLGPVAAIAVTAAAMAGAGLSSRNVWAAGAGGLPGIAAGIAGVVLAAIGLAQASEGGDLSRGLRFDSRAPGGALLTTGVLLSAAAGPIALVGALGGDLLFGAPGEDEAGPSATTARTPLPRSLALQGPAWHPAAGLGY